MGWELGQCLADHQAATFLFSIQARILQADWMLTKVIFTARRKLSENQRRETRRICSFAVSQSPSFFKRLI